MLLPSSRPAVTRFRLSVRCAHRYIYETMRLLCVLRSICLPLGLPSPSFGPCAERLSRAHHPPMLPDPTGIRIAARKHVVHEGIMSSCVLCVSRNVSRSSVGLAVHRPYTRTHVSLYACMHACASHKDRHINRTQNKQRDGESLSCRSEWHPQPCVERREVAKVTIRTQSLMANRLCA